MKTSSTDNLTPRLVGGIGEKKSNGGSQWFQQNRIYDADTIAMCLLAQHLGGGYYYLIGDTDEREL